jgi:probable phosphoglycerate mutase
MTILLLIRHATNDYIKEGRLAGWTPGVHINADGQREADALARRLAHLAIRAIYASPLERAVETAQAIAVCHKLDVHIREGLGEVQAGEWTGKLAKELQETETWKRIQSRPVGVPLPGGESIDQVQTRLVAAIDAIIAAHPNAIVVAVSHADPIKAALAHYLGLDLNNYQRLAIDPASVSVIFFGKHRSLLYRLNDKGALPALDPAPRREGERKEKLMPEANIVYDLNPVTHITVGAMGVPGKRTFYLQGRQGMTTVTLLVEKEQVAALARGINEMLEQLGERGGTVQVSELAMELSHPIEPVFRVGQMGLGYDAERKLIVTVAYELPEEENPAVVDVVRFWATSDQMRALARHVAALVAAGRPSCVMCGRPIDPEGHFCPKKNGHGAKATLD